MLVPPKCFMRRATDSLGRISVSSERIPVCSIEVRISKSLIEVNLYPVFLDLWRNHVSVFF